MMDKTAIKNFAIEARKILINTAITEAGFYGITKDGCKNPMQTGDDFEVYETLAGTENRIFGAAIKKRANLEKAIRNQGFDQVIEETAYTWFNRIIAIRFMEVNNYLPSRVRVLSSETGSNTPDIITQSDTVGLNLTSEELESIRIAKRENRYDDAFRMLFVKQCNELNDILPGLFEKTNDYMELLLKISYTSDGVIRNLVDSIPEDNFNVDTEGQVEIIGWLYQYYNTELKDDTFAKLKKNIKITKERIPAATQLFTPDWIVRYMVENSVGRVWIEHLRSIDSGLDEKTKAEEFGWKYYLPEAEQTEKVAEDLMNMSETYKNLTPQDITCIDPCMGSGHILVYMFDVLMDIYRSEGFSDREAVFYILENNIRGLDIDRRAYQLSYFALMMKARGYNRVFFRGRETLDGERVQVIPRLYSIEESNSINREQLKYFGGDMSEIEKNDAINQLNGLLDQLVDAKEYGSILKIDNYSWELLRRFAQIYKISGQMDFGMVGIDETQRKLEHLIDQAEVIANKYFAPVTNPPYMSARGSMSPKLTKYLTKEYPLSKNDMFTVFMDTCYQMCRDNGIYSLVNQQSWMFLAGFAKLRENLYKNVHFLNLLHIGAGAFEGIAGEVVQSVAFCVRNRKQSAYKASCLKLLNGGWKRIVDGIEKEHVYNISIEDIQKIPNGIFCYWLGGKAIEKYYEGKRLDSYADPRVGMATGDNDLFVRLWYEVEYKKLGFNYRSGNETKGTEHKWYPYNKGGECRRWYGNRTHVVDWFNDGQNITNFKKERLERGEIEKKNSECWNREYYFLESISWSKVSSGRFAVRYYEPGFIFDVAGCSILGLDDNLLYVMGALNSELRNAYIESLSPTLNFETGAIKAFPLIEDKSTKDEVERLVKDCIRIEKEDWDSYEISWDFKRSPLCKGKLVEEAFREWEIACNKRVEQLKENEERLNKIFIGLYQLEEELDWNVKEEDITLHRANEVDDVKALISYAVGCMFGRYSLDREGIICAGSDYDESAYLRFIPDKDAIIPITEEKFFEDDLVDRFCEWISEVYGPENLEDNLEYIVNVLGKKANTPQDGIRDYFINDFYKDHCAMCSVTGSGKRPFYWLFDSGKQNGFKCLVYMHRFSKDTLGTIRSEYLKNVQEAIENALKNAEYVINTSASSVDRAQASKKRDRYVKQLSEIKVYYMALSHLALQKISIDLDDGVKNNYSKFQGIEVSNEGQKVQTIDLLAKI